MEKGLEETFLARRHINKIFIKRWPISLIIRKMQIKTIIRYHLTPVRMSIKKKKKNQNNKHWQGVGKLECLCNVGCYRKKYQVLQKTKNTMIV